MSTKLFIQAMKALPDELVSDDVQFSHCDAFVVAAIRNQPAPMIFKRETMEWEELTIEEVESDAT